MRYSLLLADLEWVWPAIVFTLWILGRGVSQFLQKAENKARQAKVDQARRAMPGGGQPADQPRPAAPPVGRPVAAARPAAVRPGEKVQQEIQQFLRRVADNTAGERPGERSAPVADGPRPAAAPPGRPVRSQPATPRPKKRARLADEARAKPTPSARSRGEQSIGSLEQRHLRTDRFADRGAHLTDEIDQADEDLEAHLDEVFEHEIGTLRVKEESVTLEQSSAASEAVGPRPLDLAALLATRMKLREAIVLSEVINRPEHRW